MDTVQSTPAHAFDPVDAEYLVKRAVDLALAWNEGLRSGEDVDIHRVTGNALVTGGGLIQPYRLPLPPPWNTGPKTYYRCQLHERETNGGRKTDVPTGPVPLYFTSTAVDPTSTDPILISESPVKALAIASAGYPCSVGLGGVSAGLFAAGTRMTVIQPHLEPFFTAGRTVYVVLDSNRLHNVEVARAEAKIARALLDRGCDVRLVEVPPADGVDRGPDDFIAARGAAEFGRLVAAARCADPVLHAVAVVQEPGKARALLADLPFCASLKAGGPGAIKAVHRALNAYFDLAEVKTAYQNHPAHRAAAAKQALAAAANSTAPALGAWATKLLRSSDGAVMNLSANLTMVLENDPRWLDTIAFNLLANDVVFVRPPPFAEFLTRKPGDRWNDEDDTALANWFQREWGVACKPMQMRPIVVLAARRREFCPVQRRLSGLVWDGVPRVGAWLSTYCGVRPTEYSRLVGKMWLISAVARAFQPGCQVDHALVLEGQQGVGKSTAFRVLAFDDQYFTDDLRGLGDVEAAKQLRAKWICELSELAAVTRKDLETVKSFLTRRVDNYRPSYGRSSLDFPRRVVFGASVNPVEGQGYLKDASGDRRWWPVLCSVIDIAGLQRDRDQLWAEAVDLHKAGERWHPTADEARRIFVLEQEARREVDAYEEAVLNWLACSVKDGAHVSMQRILSVPLEIPLERHGAAINRVRKILHQAGWVSRNVREDGSQFKAWCRGEKAAPYSPPKPELADCGDAFEAMLQ